MWLRRILYLVSCSLLLSFWAFGLNGCATHSPVITGVNVENPERIVQDAPGNKSVPKYKDDRKTGRTSKWERWHKYGSKSCLIKEGKILCAYVLCTQDHKYQPQSGNDHALVGHRKYPGGDNFYYYSTCSMVDFKELLSEKSSLAREPDNPTSPRRPVKLILSGNVFA